MPFKLVLISLFSCLLLVLVNEFNLSKLNTSQNNGQLIYTADQPSYHAPALNFKHKGIWKDNSVGYSAFYQRPPGYGFLIYLALSVSENNVFLVLKIIQITLFALSIILLYKILKLLKINNKTVLLATLAYGVLPFFNTFTYYVLTESIAPFLLLINLYFLLKAYFKINLNSLIFACLTLGLTFLIRPQFAFFILPLFFICNKNYRVLKAKIIIPLLLLIIPFLSWSLRNYTINNEIVNIHPIYHSSNNHAYRPMHKELTDLFRVWEYDSEKFHTCIGLLRSDTSKTTRKKVIQKITPEISTNYRTELLTIFKNYQIATYQLITNFKPDEFIPKNALPQEEITIGQISSLTKRIKERHRYLNHLKTPFLSLHQLVAKSHLGLYIYQSTFRENLVMEVLRVTSFLFLFICAALSFSAIFLKKINAILRTTLMAAFYYIFYLVYIQRLNEERYYYILFALFFIGAISVLNHFYWLKLKKHKTVSKN